jgi:hypothetical protein
MYDAQILPAANVSKPIQTYRHIVHDTGDVCILGEFLVQDLFGSGAAAEAMEYCTKLPDKVGSVDTTRRSWISLPE